MNHSAAKTSEERIAILEGVAQCAESQNGNSSELEKIACDVVAKTTSPDKEGTIADC